MHSLPDGDYLNKEHHFLLPKYASSCRCCDEELGDDILRNVNADISGANENDLLVLIKRLAVTPVAISVRRF